MSEISDNIQATFRNLIQIYEEVCGLFQDLDALMEQQGYRCFHGNVLGFEQSRHIAYPKHLVKPYFSRFYANEETPMEIRGACVFFLDPKQEPMPPFIALGCFLSEGEEVDQRKYSYGMIRDAWFQQVDTKVFGQELEVAGLSDVQRGKIHALLLEEIKDVETLEKRVVEPLLALSC